MTTISTYYPNQDDFELTLDSAQMAAKTRREVAFVEDIDERYVLDEMQAALDESQYARLVALAEGV